MLKDGAPVSCDVAGDVFRSTAARSRRVGSNGRYHVEIKYWAANGLKRFTFMSRLLSSMSWITSPTANGKSPFCIREASTCADVSGDKPGKVTGDGLYRFRNCSTKLV